MISHDLEGAAEQTKISVRSLQYAVDAGDLVAHYAGEKNTKPVFLPEDLADYVRRLPTVRGGGR